MQSKQVCEEFSRKIWLYMDGSLRKDEMAYWEKHLRACPLCSTLLTESGEVLSLYESLPLEDIKEETFNVMVSRAVHKKSALFEAFRSVRTYLIFHTDFPLKKFAFSSVAFAAVLTALFIIFRFEKADLPDGKFYTPKAEQGAPAADMHNTLEQAANRTQEGQEARTKETAQASIAARKNGIMPAKYAWEDKKTAYTLRHVGSSLSRIRLKKVDYKTLDDWTLQAIALKRKIQWLEKDLDKSSM